ncbi:thioesterase-like superfamily-domain-containing protein [Xylariaceae sp. FL0804]|nr:thioesterase-like superfamily-domain-containing protein [Xylariaceae sp. FL0804]
MVPPKLQAATVVQPKGSHTYAANFPTEWCIGSVPHGGFVTSVILQTVATHFRTTLAAQKQPHTIIAHVDFLRRTHEGPATLEIRDVKLGRLTSTVHVSLSQDGRQEVVAYLTNSNLEAESGPSFETNWSLDPPPLPVDLARLDREGSDDNYTRWQGKPFPKLRKAVNRCRFYLPRYGQPRPNVVDEWLRLDSGERFTNESLGFVADIWPQMIEVMAVRAQESTAHGSGGSGGGEGGKPLNDQEQQQQKNQQVWLWFPTLTLNLDVKKALPPGGVDWLFVRVQAKRIKNGRYDYEVVILDEGGDVVALSHHVAMVVDGSRNTAKRKKGESKM